jgi:hypothetical protein
LIKKDYTNVSLAEIAEMVERVDKKVGDNTREIEGIRSEIDDIKKYGVDFKVQVYNGNRTHNVRISEAIITLFTVTEDMRRNPNEWQQAISGFIELHKLVFLLAKHWKLGVGIITTLFLIFLFAIWFFTYIGNAWQF